MTKHLLAAALVFFTTPVAADVPTASIQVNASGPDEFELQDMQRQHNWQVQHVGPSTTLFTTLSNLHVTSAKVIEGDVAFENEAPNDINVNIGDRAGDNPGVFYPSGLFVLVARNPKGQLYDLPVADGPMVNCGGNCGSEIIHLTPHVAQSIHLRWHLKGYTVDSEGHTDISTISPLRPGPYEFYVAFEGVTSECASDAFATAGQLLSCWIGKLQSNRMMLTVPES